MHHIITVQQHNKEQTHFPANTSRISLFPAQHCLESDRTDI